VDGYASFARNYFAITNKRHRIASIRRDCSERRYNRIQCVGSLFRYFPKSAKIDAGLQTSNYLLPHVTSIAPIVLLERQFP
jgi:hypothetical protein